MKRRKLLQLACAAGAVMLLPAASLARRATPHRFIEALRGGAYPGPRKRLGWKQINRPGRWGG